MKAKIYLCFMTLTTCSAIFFTSSGSCYAEDFEIRILTSPAYMVPGIPAEVRIQISNTSGQAVFVPWNWEGLKLRGVDESGMAINPLCYGNTTGQIELPPSDYEGKFLETAWEEYREYQICFDEPGSYSIEFFIESHGPYRTPGGKEFRAWEGTVQSHPVSFEVRELTGVDQNVVEALNSDVEWFYLGYDIPSRILQEFPDSTFAAYIIWLRTGAGDLSKMCPKSVAQRLTRNTLLKSGEFVPCDCPEKCNSRNAMSLSKEKYVEWRSKWKRAILKQKPGIWFAEDLEYSLAIDEFLLGDKEASFRQLEELKAKGSQFIAGQAGRLMQSIEDQQETSK